MNILISLPVLFSVILFGTLWFKHKKMNALSLILVVISVLIPFLPMIDYNETSLLLAIGMTGGWFVSLIGNKEIKKDELSSKLKLCLSFASLFSGFASSLLKKLRHDVVLHYLQKGNKCLFVPH